MKLFDNITPRAKGLYLTLLMEIQNISFIWYYFIIFLSYSRYMILKRISIYIKIMYLLIILVTD